MKNWFDNLNEVITYIETTLDQEIDYAVLSKMMGYSTYHVQRLFLMVANVSLAEYIRSRRLSQAAHELLTDDITITELAFKYGYSSPTSFNRAFKSFHGITPKDIKKPDTLIKTYAPLVFNFSIEGASTMEYKLIQTKAFKIVGKKIQTTMEGKKSYNDIPVFWGNIQKSGEIPTLLSRMNTPPFGLLGVSDYNPLLEENAFDYYIGVSSSIEASADLETLEIPDTTWAVFPGNLGSPEGLQNFQKKIVVEWLPTSGYQFAIGPDLEVYGNDNTVEFWIPVKKR